MPASYGAGPVYWDKRYKQENKTFEWILGFDDFKDVFDKMMLGQKKSRILNLGCGNSAMTENMYDHGYTNITNIDSSSVVIEQMSKRNTGRPLMKWQVGDCTKLDFEAGSFDLVIEKSLLDTLVCGENAQDLVAAYLSQVLRVLSGSGLFMCISFGDPDSRAPYMLETLSALRLHIIDMPTSHYIYACCQPGAVERRMKHITSRRVRPELGALLKKIQLSPDLRQRGVVKGFNRQRGFGFIEPHGGDPPKLFVHWQHVLSLDAWPCLDEGDEVEFDIVEEAPGHYTASGVTLPLGALIRKGREVQELSHFTCKGVVAMFSPCGFGFIRLDEAVEWDELHLEAGTEIYTSREDLIAQASSPSAPSKLQLQRGQKVRFRIFRSEQGKTGVAATEVRAESTGGAVNGGGRHLSWGQHPPHNQHRAWHVQKTIFKGLRQPALWQRHWW